MRVGTVDGGPDCTARRLRSAVPPAQSGFGALTELLVAPLRWVAPSHLPGRTGIAAVQQEVDVAGANGGGTRVGSLQRQLDRPKLHFEDFDRLLQAAGDRLDDFVDIGGPSPPRRRAGGR